MKRRKKPTPVRDLYLASCDGQCEIARWTGYTYENRQFVPHSVPWSESAADIHHLFSVSGQRLDVWSNLLAVSRPMHDADHNGTRGEPVIVRLLCIAAKSAKALALGQPNELVVTELDLCAGFSVWAWVERQNLRAPWQKVAIDTLRRLEQLKGESA